MTSLELCRKQREQELPKFVKVLKAVPEGRLDYRPDPKARTAAELAWLFAQSEGALVALLDTGTIEWKDSKPTGGLSSTIATFERLGRQRADREARRGWLGEEGPLPDGRRAAVGGERRRVRVGFSVRPDPPPRPAHHLPAPDGGQGAVDLRALGRR